MRPERKLEMDAGSGSIDVLNLFLIWVNVVYPPLCLDRDPLLDGRKHLVRNSLCSQLAPHPPQVPHLFSHPLRHSSFMEEHTLNAGIIRLLEHLLHNAVLGVHHVSLASGGTPESLAVITKL